MSDEYLWDKTGRPDPEVEHLENVLGTVRYAGDPPAMPAPAGRPRLRFAAAALLLAGVGALTFLLALGRRDPGSADTASTAGWRYRLVPAAAGNGEQALAERTLTAGGWIETDAQTRADLTVADIGRVDLQPRSRLQLVRTGPNEHRMRLERGKMEAIVTAPPRLFVTETPAGDAVDLGCRYTLEVDEQGDGLLVVELGMVMYERGGHDAYVPAAARCEARKGRGMGTPYFETASGGLKAALRRLDFGGEGAAALRDVLEACTVRDTLTLWNLLRHPDLDEAARARVQDRIEDFLELPVELSREAILARDADSLLRLRHRLEIYW